MNPTHPRGHDRAHHARARHAQGPHGSDHHPHHRHYHRHSPEHHRPRPRVGLRRFLHRVGGLLFRTRHGNLSRLKIAGLGLAGIGIVYILLVRGFFPFDIASPWIESALERQLGPGLRVRIGSTRLDHDQNGAPVLRVKRIRVYGPGDKVIASAPSAEVGLDGSSLLLGSFRARRIDLVGAETTIHVGADGRVAIIAGSDATPLTPTAAPRATEQRAAATQPERRTARVPAPSAAPSVRPEPFHYPQLIRWIDSFETSGLDGVALSQIGLKQGSLVVEDAENGRRWTFRDINIQLVRPAEGGLLFTASSSGAAATWSLTATVAPMQNNVRAIDVVATNLDPGDIMLAAGLTGIDFIAETALSGILRAQIHQDGRLISAALRGAADSGVVGRASDSEARFWLDDLQVQARYDPERKATIIDPLAIQIGANRFAFTAVVEAPESGATLWQVSIPQGLLFLSTGREGDAPLILDEVSVRGVYDPGLKRLTVQQGNLAGATTGGAFSGSLTFDSKPMLALGIAASQMPASAAKRLWPVLVAPGTRGWAMEHVEKGLIDRILVALNVPLDSIGKPHVELPDSAVRFEMTASGGAFRPAANLPIVQDAEVSAVVTGRSAHVRIAKAVVETAHGRRIMLSDGVLEVPDHVPPNPRGSIRFRFDGAADAIAEMAASDFLKGITGFTVDPASAKGTVSAQVRMGLVFRRDMREAEVDYVAEGEVRDFGADRIVRGQRVDSVNAKVSVTRTAAQVKGEGRIAGAPARFEFRRRGTKGDSEFHLAATLDEAARARIGIDLAPWLTGPVEVEVQGRASERETRIDVDADLTAANVVDLVPGWQKLAGRASRATFRLIERDGAVRLEDLSVAGSGTTIKGSLELDADGGFASANLPQFHLSDGDKASLRAERSADGTLRVSVRGDVLDARSAIRGLTAGPAHGDAAHQQRPRDLDLELRLGAAAGYNGEVARQVELRLVRRNGEIRSFSLVGKIGRDASMVGELRTRAGGRPVIYVTTGDAGALFRFADFYSRLHGGETWIMIDPPSPDGRPQEGVINVREFTIRGEPALDRMQAAAPADPNEVRSAAPPPSQGVAFLRMQIQFNRTPGRFNIREAVIFGPTMGATVDGVLDFANDRVRLRGTYVPAFGINNLFGQLPIVGLFLGGPREGLIAVTFEIVGPASGPTLRVNPMSAAAPGLLRKLFEFRGAQDVQPAAPPLDR